MIFASLLFSVAITYTTASGVPKIECPTVHVPVPNVEYQAGVTTEGNPVTPADLVEPQETQKKFRHIHIPLNLPLSAYPAKKPDFAKSDDEWSAELLAKEKETAASQKPETPTYQPDISQSWLQPGTLSLDTKINQPLWNGQPLHSDCITNPAH